MRGLRHDLAAAGQGLQANRRAEANNALDAAMRVAEVGQAAAPGSLFGPALAHIRDARRALQNGDPPAAHRRVAAILADVADGAPDVTHRPAPVERYAGVPILDRQGVVVGEVMRAAPEGLELALGGARDVWGFWDWRPRRVMAVAQDAVVLGPRPTLGKSFVVLPAVDTRTATSR